MRPERKKERTLILKQALEKVSNLGNKMLNKGFVLYLLIFRFNQCRGTWLLEGQGSSQDYRAIRKETLFTK